MKKTISIILVLVLTILITVVPINYIVNAEAPISGTCGNNLTWTYDLTTCVLRISGTGKMNNYSTGSDPMDDYYTTAKWKYYRLSMKSLVIDNGVESIGACAFYGCEGLETITIPESLSGIGSYAFKGCYGLSEINYYAKNISSLSTDTFYGAGINGRGITVTFGDNVERIPNCLFCADKVYNNYRAKVKKVVLPNSVTTIGSSAFEGCLDLTDITIPTSVTTIGAYAFAGCINLKQIIIPSGVAEINENTFSGCKSLASITIPNSVTKIGESAFCNCCELTSIFIPNSVISISGNAFNLCSKLSSIEVSSGNNTYHSKGNCIIETETNTLVQGCNQSVIPKDGSVTCIGMSAFSGVADLKRLSIPDSISTIERYAFSESGLISVAIGNGVTNIADDAFSYCCDLKEVSFGNNVIRIGEKTFMGCKTLTDITIPSSVKIIGDYAFSECASLKDITIPNGVTRINQQVFRDCTGLTSVTIPDSVTTIVADAFYGCTGLTSIKIPNSVTSIGFNSFYNVPNISFSNNMTASGSPWGAKTTNGYCENGLVYNNFRKKEVTACSTAVSGTIVLPDTVSEIADCAFSNCTSLVNISIPDGVTTIGVDAFYNVPNISYSNNTSVSGSPWGARMANGYCEGYLVYENDSKKEVIACSTDVSGAIIIPSSVNSIADEAFVGCTLLTNITLSNNITSVGNWTFAGCESLTDVIIPNSVTSIGSGAFWGCSSLVNMTLPTSIINIDYGAFQDCSNLKQVTIPDGVTSVGSEAFKNCSELTVAVISNGATIIEKSTFFNCSSLKEVTIPKSIKSIGTFAFDRCYNLEDVFFDGSEEDWFSIARDKANGYLLGAEIHFYGTELEHIHNYSLETIIAPTCTEAGEKTFTCSCGDSYTEPITKLGHSFTKYVYNNDATTEHDGTETAKCDRCTATDTRTAVGTMIIPDVFILTYNANGGTGAPARQNGNGNITLSSTKPEKDGYTFLGWAKTSGATSAQYQPGATFSLTDNTTLYAVWQKLEQSSEYKLPTSFRTQSAAYNTIVTVNVTLNNVPSDATVYIDGKPATVNGNKYSQDIGQVGSTRNVTLEVKQGNKVLDSATLTVDVNSTFMGKLSSFFSNFIFNMFSWRKVPVNF